MGQSWREINRRYCLWVAMTVRIMKQDCFPYVRETVQDASEIGNHFKILVTCFSTRVSRSAGIWT